MDKIILKTAVKPTFSSKSRGKRLYTFHKKTGERRRESRNKRRSVKRGKKNTKRNMHGGVVEEGVGEGVGATFKYPSEIDPSIVINLHNISKDSGVTIKQGGVHNDDYTMYETNSLEASDRNAEVNRSVLTPSTCIHFSIDNFVSDAGPRDSTIKIIIFKIYKCNISGDNILSIMDSIAAAIAIKTKTTVQLYIGSDTSKIIFKNENGKDGKISLAMLSLLTSGLSWYGKHGYYNQDIKQAQTNFKYNKNIIDQKATIFFKDNNIDNDIVNDIVNNLLKLDEITYNKLTVRQFFEKIKFHLKRLDPLDTKNGIIYSAVGELLTGITVKRILMFDQDYIQRVFEYDEKKDSVTLPVYIDTEPKTWLNRFLNLGRTKA